MSDKMTTEQMVEAIKNESHLDYAGIGDTIIARLRAWDELRKWAKTNEGIKTTGISLTGATLLEMDELEKR